MTFYNQTLGGDGIHKTLYQPLLGLFKGELAHRPHGLSPTVAPQLLGYGWYYMT
jgi:hypothetical protein